MKRIAAALLALAALAAPSYASWGPGQACPPGAVAPKESASEYAGLKPGDVAIPMSCRIFNASGSQCCWCSLETCARYLRLTRLFDLTRDHKAASNDREMTGVLRQRKVKFVEVKTEAEIGAALAYKLPVCVFIPKHCCVCVGLDDSGARVISNNHRSREIQVWSRAEWERLYQGWGCVLYPEEGKVEEPQGARGPHGGAWVQIGPRYAPPVVPVQPVYPPPCPYWYAPGYVPAVPAYPYYPRPGINIRVNPRPHHYHQHQHYHHGRRGGAVDVSLAAEARRTIAMCAVEVGQGNAGGSGTWIGYDAEGKRGLVASAAHVFRDLGPARVTAKGMGERQSRKAKVVYLNVKTDVAMLEVESDSEPVCTALADDEPQPGAKVYKLGFPAYAQGQLNIRTGVVKPHTGGFLFESSCYVQSGDSGGGIFLEDGSLCSIITGFYGPSGRLDPRCMMGSGVNALHTAVDKLNANGHQWEGKLRQKRKQRRQRRHSPKGDFGADAEARLDAALKTLPAADRAVAPWNADARHHRPRKDEGDVQLPAPKWKQPEPKAQPQPVPVQPQPLPSCPCPPGNPGPGCPCPPRPEVSELSPAPAQPSVQASAVMGGMVALAMAKLFLQILTRRRNGPANA